MKRDPGARGRVYALRPRAEAAFVRYLWVFSTLQPMTLALPSEDDCPLPTSVAPHPSPKGALLRFCLALVAFLGVQAVLRRLAVPGGGELIGSKVAYLESAPERYDTIFLGSSHAYRAFVPDEFDATLKAAGRRSRSFNLGIPQPNTVELQYLLREVLGHSAGNLKRVFVEYYEFVPQIDPAQAFMARNVYWHDWHGTRLAIERSWEIDKEVPEGIPLVPNPERLHAILAIAEGWLPSRYALTREHFQHWVKRRMLVARAKDIARGILGRPYELTHLWRKTDGYLSLTDDAQRRDDRGRSDNALIQRRSAFQTGLRGYLEHLERLRREDVVLGDEQWLGSGLARYSDLEVYHSMVGQTRAAGVELVVVLLPSNSCDRELEARMADELGVRVLRYNDPTLYPEFYAPDMRFDSGHLGHEGALLFSRTLARDYIDAVKTD